MSDICSPESATASLTAVSAWAASGISAERVTLEKPTPLTATLHRFSHIGLPLTRVGVIPSAVQQFLPAGSRARAQPSPHRARRNCGKVMSSFSFSKTTSTRRPTFASVYRRFQQIAGHQRTGRIVELDDDAGVGHRGREALVAGVVHDRVGVDRSPIPAHGFEFQIRRDALGAGRIGRVLEMSATLAALQFHNAALGRIPERLRPLVRHRDRPGHLAPVAHLSALTAAA